MQDAVRQAAGKRAPLRIIGRGTWLDAGPPVSPDAIPLRVDGLDGITEYTPGDLTLTALAGTTLATIDAATAAEGQWLTLDPFTASEHGGTLGATIATASVGPLAGACGLARDVVLGLELVAGDGSAVRAGGRVVKNVAGFDITRLMTGAWGTLGILTEITVRLRARPAVDETVAVVRSRPPTSGGGESDDEATVLAAALRSASVSPLAAELINPVLAARLALPATDQVVLLVRLGGNAERVASERAALATLGDAMRVDTDIWTRLRRCESLESGEMAVLRWAQLPSQIGRTWARTARLCAAFPQALMHGSVDRGIVRVIIPRPDFAELARAMDGSQEAGTSGGSSGGAPPVAERLPDRLWGAMGPGTVSNALTRNVRHAFDPAHILNPGLMDRGWLRA